MRKPAPKEITQIGTAQKRLHEDDSAHQSQSSSSSLRPSPKGKMSKTRSTKSNTPSSSAHPESETVLSPSSEPTLWETIERNTLEGVLRVLEVLLVPEVLVKLRSTQKDEKLWSVEPYESDADFVECVAFGIAVHHALNTMQGHHTVGQLVNDVIRKESVRVAAICKALQECEELLISHTTARVVATKSKLLPRALRAAVLLEFTNEESSAFFYILAVNAVPWLSAMPLRLTAPAVGRYAAMSPRAYLNFLSEDRPHFRQGILSSTEMRSLVKSNIRDKEIRMQAEAVAALSGATLTEAELLRLEKSAVATVLSEEGIVFGDATRQGSGAGDRALLDYLGDLVGSVTSPAEECDEEQDEDSSDAELEEMDQVSEEPPVKRIRGANLSKKKKHSVSRRTYHDLSPRLSHQITRGTTELTSPGLSASNPNSSRTNEEVAYTTEIEYLDDVFKYLATLIRLRTLETDMKDEDSDALMLNSRQKTESQLREMQGRERLLKLRYERRLEKSLSSGFVPRAEALATTHSLSSFEKLTILLLVGHNISHDILIAANGKYVMRGEAQRECTVGYILFVLCEGLCDRVKQRECFQRTSTLVQEGFVTVSGPSASTASSLSDLSDCLVDIDRKLVDHITGLTTSFADIVDGSSLYTPTVHLDQVVLPEEALEKVQRTVTHYDQFIECRTRIGFSEMGRQGLVMMFCGPSGTGKTMLANAIASRMKKKILLVNVIQYQQSNRTSLSSTDLFKFIFREALLQNAIVFFDECEAFFEGGSSNQLVLSLLVELERYSGLVILATNNPQNIHEAMHRRITLCIQFQTPDYLLRERIWKGHIPQRLRIAENVDFKSLAMNFELTGGLIKNAVLSAIALSVAREESSDPCVTLSDFVEGAKLQLRGLFSASALGIDSDLRHIIPRKSLDAMLLVDRTQRQVWDVVRMIKSKNLLLSSWGFNPEEHGDQMCGFVALFYGPSGCGKSMATEGIALECGVSMRVVNLTELILKCSQLSNQIETLFMEARKQNAIIVLDNAEKLLDHSDAALELSQLLQYYAARYPRPIFVLLRTEHAEIDMSATNLLFSTQVRFELPSALIRKQIWQRSFPTGVELASDVDFNVLSLESVSGGVIRTVCFQTCARCAAALGTDVDDQKKRVITMKMLKDELSIVMKQDRDRLPYRALFV